MGHDGDGTQAESRWWRHPLAAPLALYALAFVLRIALVHTRPYGDEAGIYYVAREFGAAPDNVYFVDQPRWLFFWRPLFSLLLVPGAQLSFTAFRIDFILLSSALAPLGWWFLRTSGVRQEAAIGAAVVLAAHPFFVLWGVRAFPDEMMAVFVLLALGLWQTRRFGASLAAWLAAVWVKEVALVGLLILLAEEAASALRARSSWRSLVDWRHAGLLLVLALAWAPHWYANMLGGRDPGWSRGGDVAGILEGAFLTAWLIPLVAAGLVAKRSRRSALHALAYLAFFLAYHVIRDGAVEQWYTILPATLAVCAVAAGLDAWSQVFAQSLGSTPARRLVAVTPSLLVAALLLAQAGLPAHAPGKEAVHPITGALDASATETYAAERARDHSMWRVIDGATAHDWSSAFIVDFAWFHALWPISDYAGQAGRGYTEDTPFNATYWAYIIEEFANGTFVHRFGGDRSEALIETYGACIAIDAGDYLLIRGGGCKGRGPELAARWDSIDRAQVEPSTRLR